MALYSLLNILSISFIYLRFSQLLSLIGDQYGDDADQVNGCVVSVRSKGDRISLWTRDWKNAEVTRRIG